MVKRAKSTAKAPASVQMDNLSYRLIDFRSVGENMVFSEVSERSAAGWAISCSRAVFCPFTMYSDRSL